MRYELRFTEKKGNDSLANSVNHIGRKRINFDSLYEMKKFIITNAQIDHQLWNVETIICEDGWIDVQDNLLDGKELFFDFAYNYREIQ